MTGIFLGTDFNWNVKKARRIKATLTGRKIQEATPRYPLGTSTLAAPSLFVVIEMSL